MPILLSAQTRPVMPWKNGGGSTTEILVMPTGADLTNFDWRISLATIATAGPFSLFPGIERSLSLVDGAGVDIQIQQGDAAIQKIALRHPDPDGGQIPGSQHTVQFPGEAQVSASLVEGASTDFNVMTRRTTCRHTFSRWQQNGSAFWSHAASYSLLFVADCATERGLICRQGGAEFHLQRHDSLLLSAHDEQAWQLTSTAPVSVFAVQIFLNGA